MPLEYDSKPIIHKKADDRYELIWNGNMLILSVMTEEQVVEMIEALQNMVTLPPGKTDIYRFPVMRHCVTG